MAAPLLSLRNIALSTSGKTLFENASLTVSEGERLCLVGRNGTGKSTFLKIAAGLIEPDKGERVMQSGTTIRYLPQEPDLTGYANTLAYVEAGLGPMDDTYRAQMLLESLGLTGQENPRNLSGGEARRCALARTLAPQPDILLLDEPTNHLDLPVIEWLESELQSSRSAYVLISHDRRFLEKLSRSTLWLDRGQIRRMEQGFAAFEGWRDAVLEQEELEQHKLERKIAMEEDWLRYGVTARRKRNVRRLGQLHSLRQEKREHQGPLGGVKLAANEGETSGKMVFEAKNIAFSYENRPIVQNFSTRITRGDRVALVGPNGAGKTTLLKLLTGALSPDSGFTRVGKNVDMATLDQGRAKLDPNSTLIEAISAGNGETVTINGQNRHIMGYMKDFLFSPDQANASVSVLSGGERGRLLLARALSLPSNVLVLDEPTNDLDLETLDLLQELITDYPGTVLLVSHDRDFIDRVATSTIVFEGNAVWREYPGGYTDSVNQRGKGVEARAKVSSEKATPKTTGVQQDKKAQSKRKLSQKESYALQNLPKQMEKLNADIAALQAKLDAPELYTKDPALFAKTAEAITKAQSELAHCEEQWLELEMLREELEG